MQAFPDVAIFGEGRGAKRQHGDYCQTGDKSAAREKR
jgi:hypothetical protein